MLSTCACRWKIMEIIINVNKCCDLSVKRLLQKKLNDIYKVYPVMYMYVDYSLNNVLLIKAYNAL